MVGRALLMSMLLACPTLATSQDSAKLSRLEQEVRQLQSQVAALSQLVSALRLRTGMSELEVIGELGPPTLLAGRITLRNRAVVAIETPILR